MDKITIPEKIDQRRRMLVGAAAVAATAIEFVTATRAEATAGGTNQANAATPGGAGISFGPLKQVNAGVLERCARHQRVSVIARGQKVS